MPQLNELISTLKITGNKTSQEFTQKVQRLNPAVKVLIKPSKIKIKVKVK